MSFLNWLFGRKKGVRYNPLVEFGTGPIIIPKSDYGRDAIGLMTQDGVFVPFKKQNTNTMIDPNHPAFPTMHSIDGNWQKWPLQQYPALTIRAELAARFTAANIMANYSDVEGNVRSAIIHADELIKQLNGTT